MLSKTSVLVALMMIGIAVPAGAQAPTPAAPAAAEAETAGNPQPVLALLQKTFDESPVDLPRTIAEQINLDPGALSQILAFAETSSAPGVGIALGSGLSSASDPVAFSEQVSALVLADDSKVAALVALARRANVAVLSEMIGEGLALAANTATAAENTALAALIQTQATSATAPLPLSLAFLDNTLATAAGAAGAGGDAGPQGGEISNTGNDGNSGNGSDSGTLVSQSAGVSAPTGRSTSSTLTRTVFVSSAADVSETVN
ncbi:hypothetical protein NOF55_15045 [Rhizobiaceae bacterium BDR2-2]|uniref:DUF2059 domain-containing protein n=1 Tax=Ectorhizobium quercum TaxID=2965071 RepID=A0AAE3N2E0_9HYPH|nr:hypothetical protein [Ectorhizobium quercum]MCX8998429.1 hypothetical protein [Ectorhizobium quercum]